MYYVLLCTMCAAHMHTCTILHFPLPLGGSCVQHLLADLLPEGRKEGRKVGYGNKNLGNYFYTLLNSAVGP